MPLNPKTIKSNPSPDGFATIVFGDSGSGKTTMLDSLPVGKTLIISIEGGLNVLENDHHFEELIMPSIKDPQCFTVKMRNIYETLRYEEHEYEYVGIDSSSELEKYLQFTQCSIAGKSVPSLNHFGQAAALMRKVIMEFRDLKKAANNKVSRPINPIFIAGSFPLETLRTSDQVTTRRYPMLTKKFSQEICGLVDIVAHLEVDGNQNRILRMHPTDEVMAKTRYKCLRNLVQLGNKRLNLFEQVVKPVQKEIQGKIDDTLKTNRPGPVATKPNPFNKGGK